MVGLDAVGRRVVKKVNGTVQRKWIYLNSLKPIAELDASNRVVSTFVYATHPYVPDYMVRSGVTYRILADHLGSVRMVVNTTDGTIAQQMDYDEWGNVTTDSNPGFQPFGFAAGHYDPQTRLTRFGYRDYDATSGRWLAKDPILFNGGQANLYLYCHGDPIDWLDPFGLGESHYSYINVFGHMIIHIEDSRGISHQYGFGPYGDNSAYASLFGTVEGVWTDWDVDPTSPWVQVVETNPLTSEDANALIAEFDDLVNAGPGVMGYRLWDSNCWFAPRRVVASVLNGGQAN